MILVKSTRTNNKCKVRKFDLKTEFEPEDISLVDDSKIDCNKLYKLANEKIETLNKKLERCRLIARAIECSFNRNAVSKLLDPAFTPMKINRTSGKFYPSVDSENGIFIH